MTLERRSFILGLGAISLHPLARAQTDAPSLKLIEAARKQIGVTRTYDGAYKSLSYPNGDIPRARGVCTDVIIRAYRDAFDFDLQKAVHEDMRASFSAYPKIWGLTRPDRNIDHRRVPNLETWLTRQGGKLTLPEDISALAAGDLLTMRLPGNLPHIAIVSDKRICASEPYIIHNIGAGTREEALDGAGLETMLQARFRYVEGLPI